MENEIFKLCGVAVLCAVVAAVIGKQYGGAHESVRLAGLVLALGGVVSILGVAVSELTSLFSAESAAPYVKIMLKALGIAALCKMCAELCRELGASSVAGAVESAGGLAIAVLSMPTVAEVILAATELIEKA